MYRYLQRCAAVCATAVVAAAWCLATSPTVTHAQGVTITESDSTRLTFSAFVDGYYAWDFGQPRTLDRSFAGGNLFTTQPARHNEFNVNLALIDVKLDAPRVRGRLALQAGTSVQSNYSGEAAQGHVSGPILARSIQEATAGVRLTDALWVDGGIFFSHMGMEGWISRDNLTYTRSLVAEYSPYYSSGVKFTYGVTPRWTAQLHVVNGWQNISENNTGKGAGIRVDYAVAPATTVSYYNFFSDEAGNRLRTFNGLGAKVNVGWMTYLVQVDLGTQSRGHDGDGSSTWYGATVIAHVRITNRLAIVGRVERYDDADQVIVATGEAAPGQPNGAFRANGASFGVDVTPQGRVLWRTEIRGIMNKDHLFPDSEAISRKGNMLAVTSLALTF